MRGLGRNIATRVALCVLAIALSRIGFAGINVWTSNGPDGATFFRVAPCPANPSVLMASTYELDRAYRSTDGGISWSSSIVNRRSDVWGLAVSPSDCATVYASTTYPSHVKKTTDGGQSWQDLSSTDPSILQSVYAIEIDPSSSNRVFVVNPGGIGLSTDAGATWNSVGPGLGDLWNLAISPSNPSQIYSPGTRVIAWSSDGGTTWTPSVTVMPQDSVESMTVDPSDASHAIVGYWSSGFFQTFDGGINWAPLPAQPSFNGYSIVISATNPSHLIAGTWNDGAFRSTDAGASWTSVFPILDASRVTDLKLDASGNIFAATTAGAYKSSDDGATWSLGVGGLRGLGMTGLVSLGAGSYLASAWGGMFASTNGGGTWASSENGLGNTQVWAIANSPAAPAMVFAGTENGIYWSTDSGQTWASAGLAGYTIRSAAVSPSTPSTVFAAGSLGYTPAIFRSTDSGSTWTSISTGLDGWWVDLIAVSSTDPNILYAALDSWDTARGGVYKSTDGGGTWSATGLANNPMWTVAVDPTDPNKVYTGNYEGFWKSTDGGATWTLVYGISTLSVTVDPSEPSNVLVGSYGGVFESADFGATLRFTGGGDSPDAVEQVLLDPADHRHLFAAHYGAGVIEIQEVSPTITSITPSSGGTNGGDTITIHGANFMSYPVVIIGGVTVFPAAGGTSTDLSVVTPPHTAGSVDLTVVNPTWLSSTLANGFTYVCSGPPTATVISGTTAICAGQSAQVSATYTGIPPFTVTWSDGMIDTVGYPTRTVSPGTTTTYSITSLTDSSGCGAGTSSGSYTVIVNPIPTPGPISAPANAYQGQTNLTASVPATPGSTYFWSIGNGTILSTSESSITFQAGGPGTLTIQVIETSAAGCISAPVTTDVAVRAFGTQMGYYTITPCRLIDTRGPAGTYGSPALGAGQFRQFPVEGQCGVPAGARAISANITVVLPATAGDLRIFPINQPIPASSTINFRADLTRGNNAIIPLSDSSPSTIFVLCDMPSGGTHFIMDINGYFF